MEDPNLWSILDRLMQWLILPAVAFIWAMNGRVSAHDREILRILTILEERNARRDEERVDLAKVIDQLEAHRKEDKDDMAKAVNRLETVLDKLSDKIEKIGVR
jgi:L-lactate utilization protein LutB